MKPEANPQAQPLSDVIEYDKAEHDEWHAVYMEHCGHCRSEIALPACRELLDADRKQLAELRGTIARLEQADPTLCQYYWQERYGEKPADAGDFQMARKDLQAAVRAAKGENHG